MSGKLNRFLEAVQADEPPAAAGDAPSVRTDIQTKDEQVHRRTDSGTKDEQMPERTGEGRKTAVRPTKGSATPPVAPSPSEAEPYRHVTLLSPALHDGVEEAAAALDRRIRAGRGRGRAVGMNHLIRALLEEYLSGDKALMSAVEQRVRAAMSK